MYNNIYLLGRNTIILLDIDYGYDDEKIINKIDNLKINKEEFSKPKKFKVLKYGLEIVLLGATVCIATSSFNLMRGIGFKPIVCSTDTYKTTKVIETNYTKEGINSNEYYKRNANDSEILIVKTPYEIEDDDFKRQVFNFSTNNLSNLEKDFIKNNIKNQDVLLNQDFIQKYIENTKNLYSNNYEYSDYTSEDYIYSIDNTYEIEYTSSINDLNDSKDKEIGNYANVVNTVNSALAVLYLSIFGTPIIRSIKKDVKQKRK